MLLPQNTKFNTFEVSSRSKILLTETPQHLFVILHLIYNISNPIYPTAVPHLAVQLEHIFDPLPVIIISTFAQWSSTRRSRAVE